MVAQIQILQVRQGIFQGREADDRSGRGEFARSGNRATTANTRSTLLQHRNTAAIATLHIGQQAHRLRIFCLIGQVGQNAQAATGRASTAKQLVDVLALAFPGEFHQAQLRKLGNLGPGLVGLQRFAEMFQHLQAIAVGFHINEVHHNYPRQISQA